jgi:hypothetical protein
MFRKTLGRILLSGAAFAMMAGIASAEGIGASLLTQQHPFYISLADAMKKEAEAEKVPLEIAIANQDLSKQLADVEDFITKGVDVIVHLAGRQQGREGGHRQGREGRHQGHHRRHSGSRRRGHFLRRHRQFRRRREGRRADGQGPSAARAMSRSSTTRRCSRWWTASKASRRAGEAPRHQDRRPSRPASPAPRRWPPRRTCCRPIPTSSASSASATTQRWPPPRRSSRPARSPGQGHRLRRHGRGPQRRRHDPVMVGVIAQYPDEMGKTAVETAVEVIKPARRFRPSSRSFRASYTKDGETK